MKQPARSPELAQPAPERAYRDRRGRWVSEGRRKLLRLLRSPGSCVAIAKSLGTDHQNVSRLAAGLRRPSIDMMFRISRDPITGWIEMADWAIAPEPIAPDRCGRSDDAEPIIDERADESAA